MVRMTSLVAPRRAVRTYELHGDEVYADTGRRVTERLGSHVVLWIVEDAAAWAAAIEAEADAEAARWPKSQRALAKNRRAERYAGAADVRDRGAERSWYAHFHDVESAEACAASLRRSHPNPGVRYEVVEITAAAACPDCHQPTIEADGQWRHHSLRFPADCATSRAADAGDEAHEDEAPDDWWTIDVGKGRMTCGYCHESVAWAMSVLGQLQLTGDHLLGREKATGRLVVLGEATMLGGKIVMLPHHCPSIPEDVLAKYATDAVGA
jgi:hypothetical protein